MVPGFRSVAVGVIGAGTPPGAMPRDEGGWQVAPAPDGRGMPEQHKPRPPHRLARLLDLRARAAGVELAVGAARAAARPAASDGAVQSVFLEAGAGGHVKSITTKGDTIQGTFKSKVRYPPNDKNATQTTLFSTQVPSFWDGAELTALLQSEGVQVNAQIDDHGHARCWRRSCSGSVRRCCSSACSS